MDKMQIWWTCSLYLTGSADFMSSCLCLFTEFTYWEVSVTAEEKQRKREGDGVRDTGREGERGL